MSPLAIISVLLIVQYFAIEIIGDAYASTKALGLILNQIFKSPKNPLGYSVKPLNTSMSPNDTNNLKRIGMVQDTDTQSLIAFSISLVVTYVPHADVSYL
ncbi:MAG: hypothetical protein EZS28_048692, partial [Streblomastix strix]